MKKTRIIQPLSNKIYSVDKLPPTSCKGLFRAVIELNSHKKEDRQYDDPHQSFAKWCKFPDLPTRQYKIWCNIGMFENIPTRAIRKPLYSNMGEKSSAINGCSVIGGMCQIGLGFLISKFYQWNQPKILKNENVSQFRETQNFSKIFQGMVSMCQANQPPTHEHKLQKPSQSIDDLHHSLFNQPCVS